MSSYFCFSVLSLFLFLGSCFSLMCAHCRGPWKSACVHPFGFDPPLTECGAVDARCGSVLVALTDMLSTHANLDFDMNFGVPGDIFVFKGCVTANYCTMAAKKPYYNLGAVLAHCEVCDKHECNINPEWESISKVNTVHLSPIIFQLLLLKIVIHSIADII
ncbi:hypothetical protein ILUMI_04172 [Ignelater luminosus]|uniref:UPAR/Ly6 domain-containing protein n=1 Tax=Ignelater luminosus TaxID=2038154 RepID=A0A8K0GHL4_IGNLU|nr:hypothetical protein ILUMI_04172 [Ignelater luminosus]